MEATPRFAFPIKKNGPMDLSSTVQTAKFMYSPMDQGVNQEQEKLIL